MRLRNGKILKIDTLSNKLAKKIIKIKKILEKLETRIHNLSVGINRLQQNRNQFDIINKI